MFPRFAMHRPCPVVTYSARLLRTHADSVEGLFRAADVGLCVIRLMECDKRVLFPVKRSVRDISFHLWELKRLGTCGVEVEHRPLLLVCVRSLAAFFGVVIRHRQHYRRRFHVRHDMEACAKLRTRPARRDLATRKLWRASSPPLARGVSARGSASLVGLLVSSQACARGIAPQGDLAQKAAVSSTCARPDVNNHAVRADSVVNHAGGYEL